jgi:dolichyl-phosphate-mannose-protein mannosyltransferase
MIEQTTAFPRISYRTRGSFGPRWGFLRFGIRPLICFIAAYLAWNALSLLSLDLRDFRVSTDTMSPIHWRDASLPFAVENGESTRTFQVHVSMAGGRLAPHFLHIVPDDCLVSVRINGRLLPLNEWFPETIRCDWGRGFDVPIAEYLTTNTNHLDLVLENRGGPYGLKLERSTVDPLFAISRGFFWAFFFLGMALTVIDLRRASRPGGLFSQCERWRRALGAKTFEKGLIALVFVSSYATIFSGYGEMPGTYWDESYHVASAQKYLNHVFFMEQHPPLGKLLIALGEAVLRKNSDNTQSIRVENSGEFPRGFSFVGYRFFPVLLGWLTAPVLYFIFRLLTANMYWAFALSLLYIFDNALIVHVRGAMLEGPLLFFFAASIWQYLRLRQKIGRRKPIGWASAGFGVLLAAAFTTKLVALILVLLVAQLMWQLRSQGKRLVKFATSFVVGFGVIYFTVWQIHFSLGRRVQPELDNHGYFVASPAYQEYLTKGTTGNWWHFPTMLRDSIRFVSHYNQGVPALREGNPEENGSSPPSWILGGKAISYRWDASPGENPRYLYLQSNPVAWLSGLIGLVLAMAWIVGTFFFGLSSKRRGTRDLLLFLALYGGYMAVMFRIPRVMYLYHYFIPLLLSWLILATMIPRLKCWGRHRFTAEGKLAVLTGWALALIAAYCFFSPLTYSKPLSAAQLNSRNWIKAWGLRCVHCGSPS